VVSSLVIPQPCPFFLGPFIAYGDFNFSLFTVLCFMMYFMLTCEYILYFIPVSISATQVLFVTEYQMSSYLILMMARSPLLHLNSFTDHLCLVLIYFFSTLSLELLSYMIRIP
jgi:hypothetical protein